MGDPRQADGYSDDCNTAILTPISNSPSTPTRQGTKRKFEEDPPTLHLPQPLIPTPQQTPPPRRQMFILDAFLRVFSTIFGYAGFPTSDTTESPAEDDSITHSTETSSVVDEVAQELTEVHLNRPDTPTPTVKADVPSVSVNTLDKPLRPLETRLRSRGNEPARLLLLRAQRRRDDALRMGKSDNIQSRRHREHRDRMDRYTGSMLPTAQRLTEQPFSTPRPNRVARRRSNRLDDTPAVNHKIESARKTAKRNELLLEAFFKTEEDDSLRKYMKTNYTDFKSYEDVKKEREIRQREIQKLMEESKKPKEPIVKPLSRATLSEVEKVLSDRNQGRPLIEKFRVTIHTKDVQTLREKTWLNDEIVNFYLSMVCERANIGSEGKIKVFAFNSFFYKKLSEAGYKSVERWSRKGKIDGDNLLRLDYLIIPVHLSYHWTLGVVNFTKKRVEYFDSLGGRGGQFFKHIRSYLSNESRNKINLDEWVDYSMKGAPMQENGYDCGVFLCKTAEVVCRGLDPIFTQNDITLLRKRMVAEIIKGELGVE